MDRVRAAFSMPIVVFPVCAVVAISIGMFLHLVKDMTHGDGPLDAFGTPLTALILVIVIMAAGFVASGSSKESRP